MTATTGNLNASRAVGRCYGALFFSIFGGIWLLGGMWAFGQLTALTGALIAAAILAFVATAVHLRRRGAQAAIGAIPEAEVKRNSRLFGIVNGVTWTLVFIVLQSLGALHHHELGTPAIVLLVGLHFFPMPPLYRHRANFVTGAVLVAWAILCPLLFEGDPMIAATASGSGVILWTSAAFALRTASILLAEAGL